MEQIEEFNVIAEKSHAEELSKSENGEVEANTIMKIYYELWQKVKKLE